jgi:uncharacterized OsmC-like protein
MTAEVIYDGGLEATLTHIKSNSSIHTDAPVDNQGKGSTFSPTDLAATSLAACMLTVMGIWCRDNNVNIDGARAEVTKHMAANPRRISKIDVFLYMPDQEYSDAEKSKLKHIAHTCPVAKSLHPDIEQNIVLHWVK